MLGWSAAVPFAEGAKELAHWAATQTPEDRTVQANAELRQLGLIT